MKKHFWDFTYTQIEGYTTSDYDKHSNIHY